MTRSTAANDIRHGGLVHAGDPEVLAVLRRATNAWGPRMAENRAALEREEREQREQRERESAEAAKRAAKVRFARLRRAGVPEKHLRVLLGLPDEDGKAVEYDAQTRYMARVVARWRDSKHRTLVLGGGVGVGKSLGACWLIDQGPRRPYPNPEGGYDAVWPDELAPRYVHAGRLARLSTYGRKGEVPELEIIERCALLVIDEVGGVDVGRAADWIARFDSIVASRADNLLDTVITTNLRVEDEEEIDERTRRPTGRIIRGFRSMYGERVLDRMRGDGSCWAESNAKSLRMSEKWSPE